MILNQENLTVQFTIKIQSSQYSQRFYLIFNIKFIFSFIFVSRHIILLYLTALETATALRKTRLPIQTMKATTVNLTESHTGQALNAGSWNKSLKCMKVDMLPGYVDAVVSQLFWSRPSRHTWHSWWMTALCRQMEGILAAAVCLRHLKTCAFLLPAARGTVGTNSL